MIRRGKDLCTTYRIATINYPFQESSLLPKLPSSMCFSGTKWKHSDWSTEKIQTIQLGFN